MITVREIFQTNGPLAKSLDSYVVRANQHEMAEHVAQAIADASIFIAESGTGTGKTFAYLVPALLSGKKVLISTGTRHLQDQLYQRDLPVVRDALEKPVTTALLKGRANYLCLYRLARSELEGKFASGRLSAELVRIREWAGQTRDGDIAGATDIPEDSDIWPRVTSTVENCLGSQCPQYQECFVNRARRAALEAEVVVVNHHLFFADLVLKEEGFGQLLPGVEAVIFDEAHQLPDVATAFFAISFTSQQCANLCRDIIAENLKEHSATIYLTAPVQKVEKTLADVRLSLGIEPRRAALAELTPSCGFTTSMNALIVQLKNLVAVMEAAAANSEGLASCYRRAVNLLDRLVLVSDDIPADYVPWFETTRKTFALHLTPLDIASPFQQQIKKNTRAWIFTSATLAVNQGFSHFQTRMGLEQAETGLWDSPFDYQTRTLMYIPKNLPLPSAPDYTNHVVEAVLPVLEASRGRAFLLFTSHRALKLAEELLHGRIDYPLLVQGTLPRSELLERFRNIGNAILLGTGSFWEGVDVRGEALSFVMIDKLPFASPDDPVLRARGAALEQSGRNPFMDYQLPEAVIALKQGVGRLIRDDQDRGLFMLCDPRVLTKGYGRSFLGSLPPMPMTHNLEEARSFFDEDPMNTKTIAENAAVT